VKAAIHAHVKTKGWSPHVTNVFILSFYGNGWKSKYQIYHSNDVGALFEPCLGTFVDHFMRYVADQVNAAYSDMLRGSEPNINIKQTIFGQLDETNEIPDAIQFDRNGANFVRRSYS
jgi:hypothetical protein